MRMAILVSIVVAAQMPAAEASRLPHTRSTDDVRLLAGVAPPVQSGKIKGISLPGAAAPFDQDIEATGAVGPRGGIRYLHGIWFSPEFGLKLGVDGVVERSRGTTQARNAVGDDIGTRSFTMDTTAIGIWLGPSLRIDTESLEFPWDFAEVELLVGGGPARIQAMNDGVASSATTGLRAGASLGLVFTTFSRWQFGVEGGYELVTADDVAWSNTDASRVTAAGIAGGIQLGRRW